MIRFLLSTVFFLLSLAVSVASGADFRVMSFNIRYDNAGDGANGWAARGERVAEAILASDADIVGTQEVLAHQYDSLAAALKGYRGMGCGREDGLRQGEYVALWYKTDRFDCVKEGNFWLSATPDVAGSMGWDGACVRMATWALLRDRLSGDSLMVLNTHLDHVGELARRLGARLIVERLDSLAPGCTTTPIVMGDFNSGPESEPVMIMKETLRDSRAVAEAAEGPEWTFHDFGRYAMERREIIDFIFVSDDAEVRRHQIIDNTAGAPLTSSDHCPVVVDITVPAAETRR